MSLPKRRLGAPGRALEVSALGLGCMGMTAWYSTNPVPKQACLDTIHKAIDLGCTFFDTAEAYNIGKTSDNNEQLIGEGEAAGMLAACMWSPPSGPHPALPPVVPLARCCSQLKPPGSQAAPVHAFIPSGEAVAGLPRDSVTIATKFGVYLDADGNFCTDGSPAHCRQAPAAVPCAGSPTASVLVTCCAPRSTPARHLMRPYSA